MGLIRWDDLDPLRHSRRGPFETNVSGPSWMGAGRNLTDLDALLERHGDDGTGYCQAGCNYRGGQWPAGTCPTAEYAAEERRRLLRDRNGANGY